MVKAAAVVLSKDVDLIGSAPSNNTHAACMSLVTMMMVVVDGGHRSPFPAIHLAGHYVRQVHIGLSYYCTAGGRTDGLGSFAE